MRLSKCPYKNHYMKPFLISFVEFLYLEIIFLTRYFYFLAKGCDDCHLLMVDDRAQVLDLHPSIFTLPKLRLYSRLVTDLKTSVSTQEKCIVW